MRRSMADPMSTRSRTSSRRVRISARRSPYSRPWRARSSAARLAVVEGGVLERHADAQPHLLRFGHDVVTGHHGHAGARTQQGAQHPDEGRLAGPVGPEEAVDLAPAHLEVDAVDGHRRAVASHQARGHHGAGHRVRTRGPALS